jgi:signal transduction histidine kinase
MSRRLLGPVGGPVVFFLVAALVFAGLGWVTYAALRVEQSQRESAAQADLGKTLREALWRLDGGILPILSGEDNRPYYHYAPPDPAATPLLGAGLPPWMRLHFQLDANSGWTSPQVLDDANVAAQVRLAWADLPVNNLNGDRSDVRNSLRDKFPSRAVCDLFAVRDSATSPDSLPLAAPFFTNEGNSAQQFEPTPGPTPQPPTLPNPAAPRPGPVEPVSGTPASGTASPRLFGIELCWLMELPARNQLAENNRQQELLANQKKAESQAQAPGQSQSDPRFNMRGGQRLTQREQGGDRGWFDFLMRAETFGKGLQDARNAANYPMGRAAPYTQNTLDPKTYGNQVGNGTTTPAGPSAPGKIDGYGPPPSLPAVPGSPAPPIPGGSLPPTVPPAPGMGGGGFNTPEKDAKDKADLTLDALGKLKESDSKALGSLASAAAGSLRAEYEKADAAKSAERLKKKADPTDKTGDKVPATTSPAAPAAVPPAVPVVAPAAPVQPLAIHLGSMRPQWVTAPDGTEMLVLVRTARINDKTVYQGVVIDWAKLQEELKQGVQDLFPEATLVAVKDPAGVSADRAMTTLPVQLDPGPQPELPPAGWTPLRIGLVLAWAAALVAVVAVGFSGWSLIDLAERRIRFVSAVTHELRTPLTSLRLYLDLLVSGMIQDEAKRQEYLNTLAMESDRLHRLIDNVLDFAKLEKRKKNGDIKPVKVCELMDQLRATWTDRVTHDGKELVVISTLPPEHEVCTDAAMIQQIAANLIDNARKYSRDAADNRIWVWAKPGPGKTVLLEVEDRGPGVPAGERKTIFKPFRRGEHADSTSGGAGLGLALAKSWAEVLGARLTCRPADGGTGACFRLELPGK